MKNSIRAIALIGLVVFVIGIIGCFGGGGGGGGGGVNPTGTPTFTPTYSPYPTPTYSPYPTPTYSPWPTPTYSPLPTPTYSPWPTPTYSPSPGTGAIEGTITQAQNTYQATPVPMALVSVIDQGLSAYTDTQGKFRINNVWAGTRMVMVQGNGQSAINNVNVVAGKTTVINVELPAGSPSPTPTSTTAPKGTLVVKAYGFYQNGEWVGVKYIRVWEYQHYENRWYNSWNASNQQTSYELSCRNATLNRYYVVEVEWHNGAHEFLDTNYFYYDGQTIWVYHY